MAKLTAKEIKKNQAIIPEAHRDRMRLSDDGTQLFVTLCLDRFVEIILRKTHTEKADRATFTPEQFNVSYDYGEGRRCRDGADVKDEKGNKLDAKTKTGAAALLARAVAHCAARIETMQGKRAMRATKSGVSSITREVCKLFKQYAVKNLEAADGKRYTWKTLPSTLLDAKTLDEATAEAKRIGIPDKKIEAHVKRGTKLAALMDDQTDMDIDIG